MSKENSEKILILGAGGFIGKNLFDGFKGDGLEVVGSAQSGNFIRLNILIDELFCVFQCYHFNGYSFIFNFFC